MRLMCAVFWGALVPWSVSHADEAQAPVIDQPAPAASSKQASNISIPPVVVTARRREEPAQQAPLPVSVVDQSRLETERQYQIQDLEQVFTNVTSQFLHARQSSLSIRGIGNNLPNEGLEGSVGIFLDNVYLTRPGMAAFDLFDVKKIELYRGPQGSLFGKNTTAGVLNIVTNKPSFEAESALEASFGSRDFRQFKAMLNQPLNEVAALRISAYDTHDDGWIKNIFNGKQLNEINRKGIRGQLLVQPDHLTEFRLIVERNEEDSSTGTLVPYGYAPWRGTPAAPVSYADFLRRPVIAGMPGATNVITDPEDYKVSFNGDQRVKVDQNALTLEMNRDINGYKLTSVTAWRDWHFKPQNDLDFSDLDVLRGGFGVDHYQRSQEIRLASPVSKVFDYVIGAYALDQDTTSRQAYTSGPYSLAINSTPNNSSIAGTGTQESRLYALFGSATWHLRPELDLTVGLRESRERKEARVIQNKAVGDPLNNVFPFSFILGDFDSGKLTTSEKSLAWNISPSYRLSEDTLAYMNVSASTKSGGFNLNSLVSPAITGGPDAITIDPERARNIDIGIKSNFLDQRLYVDANLFLTKVRDYQAIVSDVFIPRLTNVGDITSKGLETEFRFYPDRHWSLQGSLAYTDASFDNGTAPTPFEEFTTGFGAGNKSVRGNQVNGAPRWTSNTSIRHQWRPVDGVEHYTNLHYAWRSESFGDVTNSSFSKIPSYGLLNVTTGFKFTDGRQHWDIALWIRNALDERYFQGLTSTYNSYFASAGPPRTAGITVRMDF